jgi:antitoxin MazE
MQLQSQIQKWGNGLGLRVSGLLRDLPNFEVNDKVLIEVTEIGFSVKKIVAPQRFLPLKEDALLEGLTPENVHAQSLSKLISGEF